MYGEVGCPFEQLLITVTHPQASVRRARQARDRATDGYIVTWDVDSGDRATCGRVHRFVFGYAVKPGGKPYEYRGFVGREGVRYLGQSVLFVASARLQELDRFLHENRLGHVVTKAILGPRRPCGASSF